VIGIFRSFMFLFFAFIQAPKTSTSVRADGD